MPGVISIYKLTDNLYICVKFNKIAKKKLQNREEYSS